MKKTVTIIFAVVALSASFCGWAQEEEVTRYFSKDEMPNLIKCLPAPPDTVGADFAHDIMRYLWGKTQRGDAYRPQMAVDHFVRWAADVTDTLMKPYFYPKVPRVQAHRHRMVALHPEGRAFPGHVFHVPGEDAVRVTRPITQSS